MGNYRSGYVSLTGRPNVGKSTLLNAILGEKIAIVTPKPQTTRNRILGIKTLPEAQIIFLDTPGIHKPQHRLGEIMVKEARDSVNDMDIILIMVAPEEPRMADRYVIDMLKGLNKKVFLLINKIDTVKKPQLLSVIEAHKKLYPFDEILLISAATGDGLETLMDHIVKNLPEGPQYYPGDIVTDQFERFMVSEVIREKIMHLTGDEIPYSVATEIIEWSERESGTIVIKANIYVERDGQKGIIIGKGGAMLKAIGTSARIEIEGLLDTKVFLELWVKIRKDWRSNVQILKELGFK